jgi:hypothetical protein
MVAFSAQQIGLPGDGVDQFDHVPDPGRSLREFADALIGLARLFDRLIGDVRGFLYLTADLVELTEDAISSVAEATDIAVWTNVRFARPTADIRPAGGSWKIWQAHKASQNRS